MTIPPDEYDSPWKDILEAYFQEFMRFFFPAIHDDIDWSRSYDFLDQELQQVVRDAELGKRFADKLVKVWKQSGEETWVLIHIEIQSQEESQFSRRMFVYYYRLRDRYDCKIASLALLGDERDNWRVQPFEETLWNCRVRFEFPVIKLLNYASQWSELEASHSTFAIAVMAHLKTKETRSNAQARKEWKFRLTRQLYEQGYERQDILNLFRFIDWLMVLPEGLEQVFQAELEQFERERQMPYITSIEQMAIEQGKAEGKAEERQAIALKMLHEGIPVETIARITELSVEQIEQLQAQLQKP